MTPELSLEEYSAALEDVAAEALREVGIEGPPIDALLVAHRPDMVVAVDDAQAGRARRVSIGPRGSRRGGEPQSVILVRDEPRPERRQWSVAHEIGEHLAHRVFERLAVDPGEAPRGTRQHVANALAARLLLPAAWFPSLAEACGWDLPTLKRHFGTASHELIARRMLDFALRTRKLASDASHRDGDRLAEWRPARVRLAHSRTRVEREILRAVVAAE